MIVRPGDRSAGCVAFGIMAAIAGRGADAIVDNAVHVEIEVIDARSTNGVDFGVDERITLAYETVKLWNTCRKLLTVSREVGLGKRKKSKRQEKLKLTHGCVLLNQTSQ